MPRRHDYDTLLEKVVKLFGEKYEFPNLKNELKTLTGNITAICPIHGEFGTSIKKESDCPKCTPILSSMVRYCGRDATYKEFSNILSFAWSNIDIINNLSESYNAHDLFKEVYALYKKSTKDYKELKPIIKHQCGSNVYIPADESLAKLNKRFRGSFVFPYFMDEYRDSRSLITAVCPIHGEFKSKYYRILGKSGCPHGACMSKKKQLTTKHGKDVSFEMMVSYYLSVKTGTDTETVQKSTKNKVSDKHSESSNKYLPVDALKEVNSKTIVDYFNLLSIDDIKTISIDVDFNKDEETSLIHLKSGRKITICC